MIHRQKAKGATDRSVAPRLVPSPRYLPNLLESGIGRAGSGAARHGRTSRGEANHSIFVRAEAAHTGLVHGRRNTIKRVARDDAVQSSARCIAEVVTALRLASRGSLTHNPVNQASIGGSRRGATGRSARTK